MREAAWTRQESARGHRMCAVKIPPSRGRIGQGDELASLARSGKEVAEMAGKAKSTKSSAKPAKGSKKGK